MSRREVMLRRPSSNRNHPLSNQSCSGSVRFAEFAGGMTAECAAICCCFPCGLLNFLVLAIYKIPAGLCRIALRKKRRQRLIKKGLLPTTSRRCSSGCDETGVQIHPVAENNQPEMKPPKSDESERAAAELEKEMWRRFNSAGFWRSPSQSEPPSLISVVIVSDCKTTPIQPITSSSSAFC